MIKNNKPFFVLEYLTTPPPGVTTPHGGATTPEPHCMHSVSVHDITGTISYTAHGDVITVEENGFSVHFSVVVTLKEILVQTSYSFTIIIVANGEQLAPHTLPSSPLELISITDFLPIVHVTEVIIQVQGMTVFNIAEIGKIIFIACPETGRKNLYIICTELKYHT